MFFLFEWEKKTIFPHFLVETTLLFLPLIEKQTKKTKHMTSLDEECIEYWKYFSPTPRGPNFIVDINLTTKALKKFKIYLIYVFISRLKCVNIRFMTSQIICISIGIERCWILVGKLNFFILAKLPKNFCLLQFKPSRNTCKMVFKFWLAVFYFCKILKKNTCPVDR